MVAVAAPVGEALVAEALPGVTLETLELDRPGPSFTVDTLEALSDSTGFLGYMVLKQMGVCALGSLMLDPESMAQALMTLGANPPDNPRPAFATPDARPTPPDYLVHTEWDSPELAKLGFAKVLVNHRIRKIHDDGVMAHLIKGPYIKFFRPMMEEPGWRDHLR